MSNAQNAQIMGQVMSVVDRLAGNPNSKLDATNVIDLINKLTETVSAGYQRVSDLETSTSLTAAVTPAKTAAEVTTAPATSAPVQAPTVAEAAPAETPVAVVTETPKATAAEQPVKAAAKRTASATVKSAPAPKAPAAKTVANAPAPAPVVEAPTAKTETVAKVAPAKAPTKATAKATKKVTKEVPAPVANEDKDVATAESMIQEHGSARAAAAYVEKNRTRGRKTAWQKIIEERADQELRAAAKGHKKINAEGLAAAIASAQQARKDKKSEVTDAQAAREYSLKTTGYPFSHIDRKPFMDPEKALGADITCLIDGSKRTMMSRYIDAKYAMTPEEYIAHFDLRPDYPMTADLYKKEKRRLAGEQGLGQRKAEDEAAAAAVEQVTPATTKRRSRQRAAA